MTAQKILSIARSYLGTKEEPAGSSNVIFNTHYYGHEVSGDWYDWCCAFVWDVFRLAGASGLFYGGEKTAYCPYVQTWGRKAGLEIAKSKGQPGDIILLDWNANGVPDHIGIIETRNADGSYGTIEGNTTNGPASNGGEVRRWTRWPSQACCILRPKYDREEDEGMRYYKLKDVKDKDYRATLDKLAKKGFLKGKGGAGEELILDLSEDSVRLLVMLDRAGKFD